MTNWYALIDNSNKIKEQRSDVDPDVETKQGWKWLPIETQLPEKYDPNQFVLEGPQLSVESDKVLKYWTVREKTSDDIFSENNAKISSIDPLIFKILFEQHKLITGNNNFSLDQYKSYLLDLL